MTNDDEVALIDQIESREGSMRMRFPVDPDTTQRLKRLKLDGQSEIPAWRRLMRWIFRIQ
jgi:hypothetical protein